MNVPGHPLGTPRRSSILRPVERVERVVVRGSSARTPNEPLRHLELGDVGEVFPQLPYASQRLSPAMSHAKPIRGVILSRAAEVDAGILGAEQRDVLVLSADPGLTVSRWLIVQRVLRRRRRVVGVTVAEGDHDLGHGPVAVVAANRPAVERGPCRVPVQRDASAAGFPGARRFQAARTESQS